MSAITYAVNATTATPNPGNILLNIARCENDECFLHSSLFAHGLRYNDGGNGGVDI